MSIAKAECVTLRLAHGTFCFKFSSLELREWRVGNVERLKLKS